MNKNDVDMVWYVGYGSNLSKQRFLCYIIGGTPKYGKKYNEGCIDTTYPVDDQQFLIPHQLYFALPNNETGTKNWGQGGVAFISSKRKENIDQWTLGRIWKITKHQYLEVKKQEGEDWYGNEISLGRKDGIPIYTITNSNKLNNVLAPSDSYLYTIAMGLKESYNMSIEEIANYLIRQEGIKENFTKDDLISTIKSLK